MPQNRDYQTARIKELYLRAEMNGYLTHTAFLSLSEQADLMDSVRLLGQQEDIRIRESEYLLHGGFQNAERCIACFFPSYMTKESFLCEEEQDKGGVLACISVKPANKRFSDDLTHRDYLGAIMNLGLKREVIGDIICSPEYAAVSVLPEAAAVIENELTRVRHTTVVCERIPFSACGIAPELKDIHINIASERADAILGEVYRLSRSASQELIRRGMVSVNGRELTDTGRLLKKEDRVSVSSKGKFIYEGAEKRTKKDRISACVRVYQ
ncbi:MAG TPA: hypothetical protein DCL38_09410 [Lachnospiraceae bacterium]|nr:hypothetical protein [Lachnospiraceae bacterium]